MKKNLEEMSVSEIIEACGVSPAPAGQIYVARVPAEISRAAAQAFFKARKPEIVAELQARREAERAALQERQSKIDAIEGLVEIQEAQEKMNQWHRRFNASFSGPNACGGFGVGPRPNVDIDALKAKYPRAAAYLKAREWGCAAHYVKAKAGRDAEERIINGEDHATVIAEMEKSRDAYCDGKAWD